MTSNRNQSRPAAVKPPRIVLMRHGQPEVALTGRLRAAELAELATAYQACAIVDAPPENVRHAVKHIKAVLCSDLLRSLQSAQALGFGSDLIADALFSEARLPHFNQGRFRLPVGVWLIVLRLLWLAGFSRNGESYRAAKARAALAAARLAELAGVNGEILLVGHGVMNYLIACRLRRMGWQGLVKSGQGYWQFAVFELL